MGKPKWFKFHLYKPVVDLIAALPAQKVGEAIKALVHYADTGEIQEIDDTAKAAFAALQSGVDESIELCNQNEENGRKGAEKRWGHRGAIGGL